MTIPGDHVEGSFTTAHVLLLLLQSATTAEETEPYHDHNLRGEQPGRSISLRVRVKLMVQAGLLCPNLHPDCLLFLSSLGGWAIPNPASPGEYS